MKQMYADVIPPTFYLTDMLTNSMEQCRPREANIRSVFQENLMGPQNLLIYSQELATAPYSRPDESSPHPQNQFMLRSILIVASSVILILQVVDVIIITNPLFKWSVP